LRGPVAALAVLAALALLLAGCGRPEADTETRHRFLAMGTLVDVTIFGTPPAAAGQAAREVEALFHALHQAWNPWGDGELGRLNEALARGEPAAPGEDLWQLLAAAAALSEDSGGLFDPTLGPLVLLWGFASEEDRPAAPPPAEEIAARLSRRVALATLLKPDGRVAGPPGVQLDLGAYFKGVAVDRAIELLRARGIEHAIVNAGGDLRAIGRRGERPWRVGIRAARDPAGVAAAIEIVADEAVFTSGDYERHFEFEGRRYHHVLDPRNGYPSQGIASVTVLHRDAGRADAGATALMVAGPADWPAVAAALGLQAVLVILDDGQAELTGAMQPRLRFTDEAQARAARVRNLP
jgi:thiamine biosynthesis lipoprotein